MLGDLLEGAVRIGMDELRPAIAISLGVCVVVLLLTGPSSNGSDAALRKSVLLNNESL